jgi:8-oxo-dGTP diphosphatase
MVAEEKCPNCGFLIVRHRNPVPTVDIIIEYRDQGLVLIERANPPYGWALPGGFVDYGESLEDAARREAREETGLEVNLLGQFHTYSDPRRDPRQHTISTVFVAQGLGTPRAADDARKCRIFAPESLPEPLAFDHGRILADYLKVRPEWLKKIDKT